MNLDTWITFALASMAVVLIPGPNVVLIVTQALKGGRTTGWATVPGVTAGAFVAMTLSLLGAGTLVATSVTLFTILKVFGAAYLIWLAYRLWTDPMETPVLNSTAVNRSWGQGFTGALLISALNPKGPIFYIAFVPQFIDSTQPVFFQFAVLQLTFLSVATVNSIFWLLCAS